MNCSLNGRPLIHYAADYGQKEIIQYLISKGANVNVSLLANESTACLTYNCLYNYHIDSQLSY